MSKMHMPTLIAAIVAIVVAIFLYHMLAGKR